jgi:hypothetical protein
VLHLTITARQADELLKDQHPAAHRAGWIGFAPQDDSRSGLRIRFRYKFSKRTIRACSGKQHQ